MLLISAGWSSILRGDFETALQFTKQGLAVLNKLGGQPRFRASYFLGLCFHGQGQHEQAKHWMELARAGFQRSSFAAALAAATIYLGAIALSQQDYADALTALRQGLQVYWDTGRLWLTPWPIVYIARVFAEQNQEERAVELLATIHPHLNTVRGTDWMAAALRDELYASLEPERFEAAWAHGQERELATLVVELLTDLEHD